MKKILLRITRNPLFKDSFWAVVGNGIGNALLLIAGILIARFLGKDLYGEYGLVKTTMFYIASFATLGLGFTSTKYLASYSATSPKDIDYIVKDSLSITLFFSGVIAIVLLILAKPISNLIGETDLVLPLRALAIIIVIRAISTTQVGILSGLKRFKEIAYNSVFSGLFMLALCVPLTYFCGLVGSLASLALSQLALVVLNCISLKKIGINIRNTIGKSFKKELIKFSFPVALQESSFTICHWCAIVLLSKYASLGDVGIYTACAQWNSVILMIPSLLSNVVLSHLSSSTNDKIEHNRTFNRVIVINFICSFIPFAIVYMFASFISFFYGASFDGMQDVLRILTFSTIFESLSSVLKSELLAKGKTWWLFSLRFGRDLLLVILAFLLLTKVSSIDGAVLFSIAMVVVSFIFFISLFIIYKVKIKLSK